MFMPHSKFFTQSAIAEISTAFDHEMVNLEMERKKVKSKLDGVLPDKTRDLLDEYLELNLKIAILQENIAFDSGFYTGCCLSSCYNL